MESERLPTILDAFTFEETLLSPTVEGTGVRVAFDRVFLAEEHLRFRVLVTWLLTLDHANSFADVVRGMTLVIRDGLTGRATIQGLLDPGDNPLEVIRPNFKDQRRKPPSGTARAGNVNVPVTVECLAAPDHPGFFVHVALLDTLSNVVCVPPSTELPPP